MMMILNGDWLTNTLMMISHQKQDQDTSDHEQQQQHYQLIMFLILVSTITTTVLSFLILMIFKHNNTSRSSLASFISRASNFLKHILMMKKPFSLWWWFSSKQHPDDDNPHRSDQKSNQKSGTNSSVINSTIYQLPYPPGPLSLPIIGNLHQLARYSSNPWQGFDHLRSQYGNVLWLQLGRFQTVLISSVDAMREVLLHKGDHFADRPHFNRHALYFNMDRQNALALCDWTDVHKQRRSIAHAAVIPRFGTKCFQRLSHSVDDAIQMLLLDCGKVNNDASNDKHLIIFEKQSITELCCQVFFHFLMNHKFNPQDGDPFNKSKSNEDFKKLSQIFDMVFYDINQMYLSDFLPWLQLFSPVKKYFRFLSDNSNWAAEQVEKIVLKRFEEILQDRKMKQNQNQSKVDSSTNEQPEVQQQICDERFVDRLLLNKQYKSTAQFLDFILEHYLDNEKTISWSEVLYEIGDLIGGNSAVANLCYRLLGHLAVNPEQQQRIYEEVRMVAQEKLLQCPNGQMDLNKVRITIEDQHRMPLITAAIMETLRLALSPIVPHFSRWDTSIQGFFIPKGTMILFNIYHLNLSSTLYEAPFKFDPTRFITTEGAVLKPEHFFPFSHGRRSCLGYKMVNTITSTTVANLLLKYQLTAGTSENEQQIRNSLEPKGSVALPYIPGECFHIVLKQRQD